MSLRLRFFPLVALLALAPPIHAQGTAADTAHWRATKIDLDSIARDKSAPQYSKRAQARIRQRDSLRLVGPVVPPDTTTPVPPTPVAANVDIHSNGSSVAVGASLQLYAEAKTSTGIVIPGAPISWGVSPVSVADLSGTGLLTGKAAGTATVVARSGTVTTTRAYAVTGVTPVPPDTTKPPVPPDTTKPPVPPDTTTPPPIGTSIAAQPQNVPKAQYPACASSVPVSAGASLQAAINSAPSGACLLLAPGAAFVGNFSLPNRSTGGYVIVQTLGFVSAPGVRMTPTRAAPLAKILSPNYTEAIGTNPGAHGYIFRGVEFGTTPAAQSTGMNVLVRLTDPTSAAPPSDIQFQEVYVHGTPTLDMRRAFRADAKQIVLVDSWVDDIHSNNSDSQAWLAISCAQGQLVQNNRLTAGHEIVMFGGGDPPNAGCIPQDIVLRQNHITRPSSWYKVWQVKNCIETKDVIRYVIEANVIENCWPDAQAGFAFVMKSENQDGTAAFTTTSDVTIRYNAVNSIGNGFNLSGKGSSANPNVTASRFDIHDNVFKNFTDQAIEVQLLSGVTDVQLRRNSLYGKNGGGSGVSLDGGPAAVRLVANATALHAGAYGVKCTGQTSGTASLNACAPGYVWTNNLLVGDGNCGPYPATTTCTTSFPALPTATYGADTALVNRLTAGVVVADPLAASLARKAGRRGLKYPWVASPPACRVTGKPLPPSCDRRIDP